jgi:energy-converting hydrogenase Eha subunit E
VLAQSLIQSLLVGPFLLLHLRLLFDSKIAAVGVHVVLLIVDVVLVVLAFVAVATHVAEFTPTTTNAVRTNTLVPSANNREDFLIISNIEENT